MPVPSTKSFSNCRSVVRQEQNKIKSVDAEDAEEKKKGSQRNA
jgi:hypothetical protein